MFTMYAVRESHWREYCHPATSPSFSMSQAYFSSCTDGKAASLHQSKETDS